MYLIRHIKNKTYYKNKISKDLNHYVFSEKEARKFKSKNEASKFLSKFNHPENFELIKI